MSLDANIIRPCHSNPNNSFFRPENDFAYLEAKLGEPGKYDAITKDLYTNLMTRLANVFDQFCGNSEDKNFIQNHLLKDCLTRVAADEISDHAKVYKDLSKDAYIQSFNDHFFLIVAKIRVAIEPQLSGKYTLGKDLNEAFKHLLEKPFVLTRSDDEALVSPNLNSDDHLIKEEVSEPLKKEDKSGSFIIRPRLWVHINQAHGIGTLDTIDPFFKKLKEVLSRFDWASVIQKKGSIEIDTQIFKCTDEKTFVRLENPDSLVEKSDLSSQNNNELTVDLSILVYPFMSRVDYDSIARVVKDHRSLLTGFMPHPEKPLSTIPFPHYILFGQYVGDYDFTFKMELKKCDPTANYFENSFPGMVANQEEHSSNIGFKRVFNLIGRNHWGEVREDDNNYTMTLNNITKLVTSTIQERMKQHSSV